MSTYSFVNITASITGPGGLFTIGGDGAANSEEGITIEMAEDRDNMQIGADGTPMHSLHAGKGGTFTFRLLKTSPVNQQLSLMHDYQQLSSVNWGQNIIVIRNTGSGDIVTGQSCAFKRWPNTTYAKDGGTVEWAFNVGKIDGFLGLYS